MRRLSVLTQSAGCAVDEGDCRLDQDPGDVKLTPSTYLVNKRGEIVKRYR